MSTTIKNHNESVQFVNKTLNKMKAGNLSVSDLPEIDRYQYLYHCERLSNEEMYIDTSSILNHLKHVVNAYSDTTKDSELRLARSIKAALKCIREYEK